MKRFRFRLEQVLRVLPGHPGDRADPRTRGGHEALALQKPQRLAHGYPGDAVGLGEPQFGQSFPDREPAGDDVFAELAGDLRK